MTFFQCLRLMEVRTMNLMKMKWQQCGESQACKGEPQENRNTKGVANISRRQSGFGNGKIPGDGTHIVYVNGAYRGNNPIGKLMHALSCENLLEMFYRKLAGQVKYYKEDEKEVAVMSKIVEELIDMEKKEIALKIVKDGKLQEENVITYFGFSLEQNEEHQEAKTV